MQEAVIKNIDTDYSYQLAKRMEQFRSNEKLGYRPAGSKAEFLTGEMLKDEMQKLGLSDVCKNAVTVDGWEFKNAELAFETKEGKRHTALLGAYQTDFVTDGEQAFSLMYLGKGTEADYEGKDVTGKLVLVDINQRDEWWINYPVYQAHLKGAAAVIAVQCGGYGEVDAKALNAQDIAGPEDAPAFSISREDAALLRELLDGEKEATVWLKADSRVKRDCTTYNISGCIPGKHPERMVLLSAHYDSYFSGFQDDNTAVAMMFGIAKTLIESGFKPNNTIVFCAMAAEEWGVVDSNFDWSTGAYEQIFTAHPEWVGKVIADLNFELPALAHGTRARIRCCYEYVHYIKEYLDGLPELTKAYPEMTSVTAPIETWSDDFSMAIAGIPSMVNDFTGGSFMETHYHSQFDNDDFYDEAVYRLHHELFTLLILALDETAVVPLDFTPVLERILAGGSEIAAKVEETQEQIAAITKKLIQVTEETQEKAKQSYEETAAINTRYHALLAEGNMQEAEQLFAENREREKQLLVKFKQEQDHFVRIDWYGEVFFPHEILWKNIGLLQDSVNALEQSDVDKALEKIYQVDNNAYAFMFDEYVYRHFTDYVFNQPKDRLKWGYGRLLGHEDLYHVVKCLLKKRKEADTDYREELHYLKECYKKQTRRLCETLKEISQTVKEMF
ncbi:peptidase [Roseburia intestinalis]|uniref:Peptidase n=2 Tax=Roseburia intestinalis TaxID=166486 RepID=A0A3R6A6N3_9FIRM|nr:peptidase [Roseburia intestinalis]